MDGREKGNSVTRLSRNFIRWKQFLAWGFARELEYVPWLIRTRNGRHRPSTALNVRTAYREYSESNFAHFRPLDRAYWLFHLLKAIPHFVPSRILIIGPRFPVEYHLARSFGLEREQIVLLDIYSYSPKVQVGDMHELTKLGSFDCIVIGWTLLYSPEPNRVGQQVRAVLERGGYLVVGMDVSGQQPRQIEDVGHLDDIFRPLTRVATLDSDLDLVVLYRK